ncbi:MAG TPA: TonB-dependent receptor [Candidatus Eremiobacteraceae bacterium]|nr:TonB-dependent receptor [Candidatus Eremiobacteraceae bacterium]
MLAARQAAVAGLTGQISGTVTDATTHAAIQGALIDVVAPSGHYSALTDVKGAFGIVGITPDTYRITVTKAGYELETVDGVTVLPDDTKTINVTLGKEVRTIARIGVRAPSSAFQPNATEDSYAVTSRALENQLGKKFNTDEKALLSSLPSVTLDSQGTVKIRGGFDFQTAYTFEGIDYTQPTRSVENRNENVANSNTLNGIASMQLIPGGGDASHGGTGTGLIALQAKRGTYPGYGTIDLEETAFPYLHQLGLEYGIASANNRYSNYIGFTGVREDIQNGPPGLNDQDFYFLASGSGTLETVPADEQDNDLVDNFIYKFGKSNNKQLQFFWQNQVVRQDLAYVDVQAIQTANNIGHPGPSVLTVQQASAIDPLWPGAFLPNEFTGGNVVTSPFEAYKFEYSDSFNPTTFGTVRFYRTFSDQTQVLPAAGTLTPQNGGIRTALASEATHQDGKQYFEAGGDYQFAQPFGTTVDYTQSAAFSGGFTSFTPYFNSTGEHFATVEPVPAYDFLPADFEGCPAEFIPAGEATPITVNCGYLTQFFPHGAVPHIPPTIYGPDVNQQIYGAFLQDTTSMSSHWKAQLGVRLDGYNFLIPNDPDNPPAVAAVRHQHLVEPHLGLTNVLSPRDSIRATFGRTLAIPLPSFLGENVERSEFNAFNNIPSYDNLTGMPAMYCGLSLTQACTSYADQLYWLARDTLYTNTSRTFLGLPTVVAPLTTPLQGATFTNYDLSYSHEFNGGFAARFTPFYRRGYNIVEQSANIVGYQPFSGLPIIGPIFESNLGIQKATGAEFDLTKDAAYGLSGQISATYINQIGNDPPGEYLPSASLLLGLLYHSPNLSPFQGSLALTDRTRNGWKFNEVTTFDNGYPMGAGIDEAAFVNGLPYVLPNTDGLNQNVNSSPEYVDPEDPGTVFNPNIAATRGVTVEKDSAGGFFSRPRSNTNVTIEYNAPGSASTYGVSIYNIFDQVYGVPLVNIQYAQPVATGVNGNTNPNNYPLQAFSTSPFVILPDLQPLTIRFYWQIKV